MRSNPGVSTKRRSSAVALIDALRELGLQRYPGAHLKSPWPGHLDLAVNDKTFAYLSAPGDPPSLSLKLPLSRSIALEFAGASPTAYGLGRAGWVSLSFEDAAPPPRELLEQWLEESYRAQAPKRLVAQLDAEGAPGPAAKKAPRAESPVTKPKPPAKARATKARSKRA